MRLVTRSGSRRASPRFDTARAASPAHLDRVATLARDPLLLYFTSGTTAQPKLVLHTHASFYPVGHLSTMYWIGLRDGDVHHNISSPGWAKHAWSSLFAPWNAGATIVVHDQAQATPRGARSTVLREQRVTTLCAPPTVWRMIILEDLGARPPAIREIVGAGEPLNPEVIDRIQRAWGITIRDGYGQTETTCCVGNPPGLPVKPGSMGKPLPGYDVAIVDASGAPADDGEVAIRIAPVRPLALMDGYMDDPERTAEVHGRRSVSHRRRGARSTAMATCTSSGAATTCSRAATIGSARSSSRAYWSSTTSSRKRRSCRAPMRCVFRCRRRSSCSCDPARWRDARDARAAIFELPCSARLAPYKRVRRIEFCTLPKTISGKIRRVELRKAEERRAVDVRNANEHWIDD